MKLTGVILAERYYGRGARAVELLPIARRVAANLARDGDIRRDVPCVWATGLQERRPNLCAHVLHHHAQHGLA